MAGQADDPYDWDVERVVQELCSAENRPWMPKLATKRPDSEALSKALLDNDIDGETLLTYEDVMSSFDGLFQSLGLVKIPHKMTLVKAIKYLKSKSRGYRQYQADMVEHDLETPSHSQEGEPTHTNLAKPEVAREITNARVSTDVVEIQERTHQDKPAASSPQNDAIVTNGLADFRGLEQGGVRPGLPHASNEQGQSTEEPSQRKRKIAPVLISAIATTAGAAPAPTAADDITRRLLRSGQFRPTGGSFTDEIREPEHEPAWEDDKPNAYLGRRGLITARWVPSSSLLPGREKSRKTSVEFSIANTKGLVPDGRRKQIGRAVKRLFRTNNQSLNLLLDGQSLDVEPEEEDEILPVFGDSDSEQGYDTETMEAIAEEEEELRREREKRSSYLANDDIERVLQEEIRRVEEGWNKKRLPKRQREAKEIWNKARRRGCIRQIAQVTSRLRDLDNRIDKLCNELRLNEWPTEKELRDQARCLDCSVEDRKHERWLLEVLRGPEPPGPETLPSLRLVAKQREVLSDEDAEYLTSGEDDFVVDDTVEVVYAPDPVDIRPESPMNLDNVRDLSERDSPDVRAAKAETPASVSIQSLVDGPIIDLTGFDSEPVLEPNPELQAVTVNLLTPEKPKSMQFQPRVDTDDGKVFSYSEEDLDIPYSQPLKIAAIPDNVWKQRGDYRRLLISVLWKLEKRWRNAFFHIVQTMDPPEIWTDNVIPVLREDSEHDNHEPSNELGTVTARLFRVFVTCRPLSTTITRPMVKSKATKLKTKVDQFESFCDFVDDVVPYFSANTGFRRSGSETRARQRQGSDEFYSGNDIEINPSKKRRKIVVDQAAKDLRENDQLRLQEQEMRRKELRKKLAASDSISSDKSRLIINESKQDDQGLIYVNEDIGKRIKNHQIEGVRFMWNQIICDSKVRQGCLLAHTMGLGKTMQVITLLVAIAEASQSSDESIRSQIPKDLRESKTLVLCPSLLVDNWMDELLMWAPEGLLGQFFKLESATKVEQRVPMIRNWYTKGGVLLIGYDMFKRVVDKPDEELPSHKDAASVWEMLTNGPNLVVADEAHKMKNSYSKLSIAASRFRTHSRIALTGSPLANNVVEFYNMINWVAPHYLGPPEEFQATYADPIQAGLYEDSTYHQFRKAKKQLAVLEATVAPKTNRATIKSCLKNDLPPKMEFVLTVPLTKLQAQLYDAYLGSARNDASSQASIRGLAAVANLGLIVNHPSCWKTKLEAERDSNNPREGGNGLANDVISEGLSFMKRQRDLSSLSLSWKTEILVAILDECERVGDKVLIFSHSIPTLDYLDWLCRATHRSISRLDGKTAINKRQQLTKDFNTGDNQIYLISTTAGGVGLNIYGANRVVLFDFKYNPIHEQQAVGRAYRIGQQKPVYVYRFISGGTFEQALHNRAVFKTQLASRVVDKENPKRWSKKETEYLRNREDPPQQDLGPFVGKDVVLDSLLVRPNLAGGIRSLMMTDTFEEEDPTEILTPEEVKDVKDQVYINSIRHSNPKEFQRLEQERLSKLGVVPTVPSMAGMMAAPGMPHLPGFPRPGAQTAVALPPVPRAVTGGAAISSNQPASIQQPAGYSIHSSTVPYNAHTQATASAAPPNMATGPPFPMPPSMRLASNSHSPAPSQAELRGGPAPMPMAGANTFFRNLNEKSTPPPAENAGSSPAQSLKQIGKPQKSLGSAINWPVQFEHKILESLEKITDTEMLQAVGGSHSDVAKRIATSTWQKRIENRHATLPDFAHMKELCGSLENPRFAAAVVTGILSPAQLAQDGVANTATDLRQLDEQEFRHRLKLGRSAVKYNSV
ncbi:Protein CHROMATIN REMODELING 20 [Colletotrichum chlorophyti]|uniref:Protein CHROMATIN REMODELING 20 n=1 Tax=Colletotrichum chlorophyti TaxID=708187 RepID=A0A1Q8S0D7_9PEZI|nr:Protein CHROMATIN REMODELING 20 [Colletotrichum chlorophyti]